MSVIVVNGQQPTIVVNGQQPSKHSPLGLKTLVAGTILAGAVAIPVDIVSQHLMKVGMERQYNRDLLGEQNMHSPGDHSQISKDIKECRV